MNKKIWRKKKALKEKQKERNDKYLFNNPDKKIKESIIYKTDYTSYDDYNIFYILYNNTRNELLNEWNNMIEILNASKYSLTDKNNIIDTWLDENNRYFRLYLYELKNKFKDEYSNVLTDTEKQRKFITTPHPSIFEEIGITFT